MIRRVAVLSASLMLVAACGGSDDSSSADEPAEAESSDDDGEADGDDSDPASGDGSTFRGELEDGSVLTVRLDVEPTDPVIAPFVAFREQAGATDPIVWVVGSLEAPDDFDTALGPPTGRFLTFVEPGAEQIADTNPTATFACSELDDWFGTPEGDAAVALNESFVDIVESTCGGQTLQVLGEPGTTTDYALIINGDAVPEFEAPVPEPEPAPVEEEPEEAEEGFFDFLF